MGWCDTQTISSEHPGRRWGRFHLPGNLCRSTREGFVLSTPALSSPMRPSQWHQVQKQETFILKTDGAEKAETGGSQGEGQPEPPSETLARKTHSGFPSKVPGSVPNSSQKCLHCCIGQGELDLACHSLEEINVSYCLSVVLPASVFPIQIVSSHYRKFTHKSKKNKRTKEKSSSLL